MSDAIPSKWVAIVVQYGEGRKHFYMGRDTSPFFFATEAEAQNLAEAHCREHPKDAVLVLRVDRLVYAKPIEFDNIRALYP